MRIYMSLFAFLLLGNLLGCMKKAVHNQDGAIELEERVQLLELKLAEATAHLESHLMELDQKTGEAQDVPEKISEALSEMDQEIDAVVEDEMEESQIESLSPEKLYSQAFDAYQLREFSRAEALFSRFIKTHQGHKLQANALYWKGESFYDRKRYEEALLCFNDVVETYPTSPKAPDALLKVGFTELRCDRSDHAQEVFMKIGKLYPYSKANEKAKEMLN